MSNHEWRYLEIYKEQITDLLEPSSTNLMTREDTKRGVYVDKLTEQRVRAVSQATRWDCCRPRHACLQSRRRKTRCRFGTLVTGCILWNVKRSSKVEGVVRCCSPYYLYLILAARRRYE